MSIEFTDHELIGRCGREKARGAVCGQKVYSDSNYANLGDSGLICEDCVDDILTPYVEPDVDTLGRMNNRNKSKGSSENRGVAYRNYSFRKWEKK